MTGPTSSLPRARFQDLADAYGGDLSRWPEDDRDAAALLMADEPAFAARLLAEAADLDAALDAWRPSPVSRAVQEAILAAAPRPRRGFAPVAWLARAGLGAGLAAACAAGVVFGAQLSALDQPPSGADAVAVALAGYDASLPDDAGEESAG
ncbi:MAG: hypothetical protein ACK4YQ_06670 [Phenylobacterium sp.]|uniref:hypothetical protein n=1 Tax=Phenylobacterium sp. TaxID=1871053 RepID=UPI00391C061B